ncbi:ROK family protein [Arcanobacterium haemolyticum]|nr:ROK family protein [Arcanobacterium haemolyticum]
MSVFAGIDVGGTTVKSIVVDEHGDIIDDVTRESSVEGTITLVRMLASELVERHPDIAGIGIVTPGTVDAQAGVVGYASNLNLTNAHLAREVEEASGRPARLDHDGRGAGMAEMLFGAARQSKSSVVIPIGTGISAAICLPGMVWAGETFQSGEIGHIPVRPGGDPCSCGQQGCLELYASARGIGNRYHERTGKPASARAVEDNLDSDPDARAVWDEAIDALALVLTQLTLTLDPGTIVIAGGLSGAGETLVAPLREALARQLAWRAAPRVVASKLGSMAGRWGAAVLGCQAAGSDAYKEWTL